MPSFYIMSLLDRQKEKYGEQIAKAREELAHYEAGLDAQVGTEVAAIVRQYIHPPWHSLLRGGKMPEVPPEGQKALAEAQRLIRQETSITRHLHSPICSYHDGLTPPHVLSCHGLDWDDLESLHEDGKLPLRRVLWLLDVLLNTEMRLPSAKDLQERGHQDWDEADTVEEWHRLLRRRRRRLIRFLRTAAKLEEDLVPGFI